MKYNFRQITQEQVEDIAFHWHYDGMYAFYNMEADKEDLAEFIDPAQRENSTFAVFKTGKLVGFFTFNQVDSNTIDIGLGMRPDLTGKGNGAAFVKAGIEFAKDHYFLHRITLSVATFNKRAINVYKKAGFEPVVTFVQATNGSRFEFLKMLYEVKS